MCSELAPCYKFTFLWTWRWDTWDRFIWLYWFILFLAMVIYAYMVPKNIGFLWNRKYKMSNTYRSSPHTHTNYIFEFYISLTVSFFATEIGQANRDISFSLLILYIKIKSHFRENEGKLTLIIFVAVNILLKRFTVLWKTKTELIIFLLKKIFIWLEKKLNVWHFYIGKNWWFWLIMQHSVISE